MEFGIGKCAMLIMRSGKRQMMKGKQLPNEEKSKRREKRKLESIESGHHLTRRDERKKLKMSISGERETKPRRRNLIKGINNRVVPLVRHLGLFLK